MNRQHRRIVLGSAALIGCIAALPSSVSAAGAQHASATLSDAAGNEIGFATFVEDASGTLHVNVKVDGLTPGQHGIHIHNTGQCSPTFAAAGAHHNPLGVSHGSHAGDLPNLDVNVAGRGSLNATTDDATLSAGLLSVFDANGSALVIHADPDDLITDPTGNSGARIACGVISAG